MALAVKSADTIDTIITRRMAVLMTKLSLTTPNSAIDSNINETSETKTIIVP